MADESVASPVVAAATVSAAYEAASYQQLTQTRVPLEEADAAFATPDAAGRLPIVILPDQPLRIRNELVIGGILAILAALNFNWDIMIRGGLILAGVVVIFLGVFQSFIVVIPEGSRAILLRGGKFLRTIGAGRHVLSPAILVTRLVTAREIPFAAMATGLPTRDDVRVDIDILLTFTITEPEKFVFAISAPDFDQVCQAASLEAARELVRSKRAEDMLDLGIDDYSVARDSVGAGLAPYGVTVERWIVTRVQPPIEFMESREAKRMAAVRRDEQTERFALEQRLMTDRDALERQHVTAQRELIDLEAANESLRLERLEERPAKYPAAARQDVLDRRIEVAHELAGNTRAMIQVGSGGDVSDALIFDSLADDGSEPRRAAPGRRAVRPASDASVKAEDAKA